MVISTAEPERALVLAHYHARGLLRSDTLNLLGVALDRYRRVILVSTCLAGTELARVPRGVEVHSRTNVGYDFYSYRHGILELLSDAGTGAGLAEIWLMNSSFICLHPGRFLERLCRTIDDQADCFGLVRSLEVAEHIQSYVVILKRHVFRDPAVRDWWLKMLPLNERTQVIQAYEIGLSQMLLRLGYRIRPAYDHRANISADVLRLSQAHAVDPVELNARLNPSHFHWWNLLQEFATLKIEVFRSNPFQLNLRPLLELARSDVKIRQLLEEGLQP
jgi:Rhamnan synthesis protein F